VRVVVVVELILLHSLLAQVDQVVGVTGNRPEGLRLKTEPLTQVVVLVVLGLIQAATAALVLSSSKSPILAQPHSLAV
jgi:hypothetical protein